MTQPERVLQTGKTSCAAAFPTAQAAAPAIRCRALERATQPLPYESDVAGDQESPRADDPAIGAAVARLELGVTVTGET